MRRWLACGMLTVCVLLGGCATPATAQPPTTNGFTCRVTADYDGLVFAGSLQRKAGESLTLAVQEPPTLQGLTLSWDGQALTAAIHGISATVDAQKIPQAAVMPLLLNVLDAAAETATDGEKTADGWQLSGEWEGTAYTLVSDPQTGNLISVSVPTVPLTVRFSDFYPLV